MMIRPSTAQRNEYLQISRLAHESGEPIFIINKGEADGAYMSTEAHEEWEKMLAHRASILEAEAARLAGAASFTQENLDAKVEALLNDKVYAGVPAQILNSCLTKNIPARRAAVRVNRRPDVCLMPRLF